MKEPTSGDLQLLTFTGHQIAVAIENARLFSPEQRRAEQFRLIGEVGRHILFILDVDRVLDQLVRRVGEILGYYLVGIGLVEGDEIVVKTGIGPYWEGGTREPVRLKIGQQGLTGWVAATGEHLLAADVTREPRYYPVLEIAETRSALAVPPRAKGQVIGVLDVQRRRLAAFDKGDVVVLQSLPDQAAMAVENARLFASEQRRAEGFRLIGEVGRRITSILVIDDLLSQIVRSVAETLGYYRASIALVEGDDLVFTALVGPGWKQVPGGRWSVKVGEGVTGWASFTWPTGSRPPCTPCGRGSHHWTVRPRFRVRRLS